VGNRPPGKTVIGSVKDTRRALFVILFIDRFSELLDFHEFERKQVKGTIL
jgi:hypothetical protein